MPSGFLLLKVDFDGCLPAFVPVALEILFSLLGAPFITVVDMLAGRCRPLPTRGGTETGAADTRNDALDASSNSGNGMDG